MNIDVNFQPEYKDLRLARRLKFHQSKSKDLLGRIILILFLLFNIVFFTFKYYSTYDGTFIIIGGVLIVLTALCYFYIYIHGENKLKEHFAQELFLYENYHISIDDQNIIISSKFIREVIPWNKIKNIIENKHSIIFFYTISCNIYIPKKYLPKDATNYLKDNIKLLQIPYRYFQNE